MNVELGMSAGGKEKSENTEKVKSGNLKLET